MAVEIGPQASLSFSFPLSFGRSRNFQRVFLFSDMTQIYTNQFIDPKAVAWGEHLSAITRLFAKLIRSQFPSLVFFALAVFRFLCFLFGLTVLGQGILTVLCQSSLPVL
jgi:hypothetical protein